MIVAITLLALGLVGGQSGDLRPLPPNTSLINRVALVGPQHRYLFIPVSGRVVTGVKYRYSLQIQCGLAYPVGPDFDGSLWDPLDSRQRTGGPPPGFSAPVDHGYMVLVSATVAEFHSSGGSTARFRRHSGSVIASLCM
ncbi:MAG: hypothetical protein M3Z11_03855 [Candidatus Dormibacteraeota bacterium]|nr:hypothetical protein [Candidatus Dormibacteraeota bacterium]